MFSILYNCLLPYLAKLFLTKLVENPILKPPKINFIKAHLSFEENELRYSIIVLLILLLFFKSYTILFKSFCFELPLDGHINAIVSARSPT